MASKPTQRAIAYLKKQGYTVAIVEKWNSHARIRQDLFGCIDLLAIKDDDTLGVQTTSGSNTSKRVTKALAEPRLAAWLAAGRRFIVMGWAKRGPRGKPKLWTPSVREITREEIEQLGDQP